MRNSGYILEGTIMHFGYNMCGSCSWTNSAPRQPLRPVKRCPWQLAHLRSEETQRAASHSMCSGLDASPGKSVGRVVLSSSEIDYSHCASHPRLEDATVEARCTMLPLYKKRLSFRQFFVYIYIMFYYTYVCIYYIYIFKLNSNGAYSVGYYWSLHV